jgi:hypothetical protein
VRSTFTEVGPAVEPREDRVVDLGAGTADVDSYLAGLWSK